MFSGKLRAAIKETGGVMVAAASAFEGHAMEIDYSHSGSSLSLTETQQSPSWPIGWKCYIIKIFSLMSTFPKKKKNLF